MAKKVHFEIIDLVKPRLGLTETAWNTITSTVNVVLHNAWSTNHTLPLSAFEEHIVGTRSIFDLASQGKKQPRLFFVSSIAATSRWTLTKGEDIPVPELVPYDHRVPSSSGYGQSKHVAECILDTASEKTGTPVTILRIGQIAGSTDIADPVWPAKEWFPILVRTSQRLGCLPADLPAIDFLPINWLVTALTQIVTQTQQDASDASSPKRQVINIVNSKPTAWSEVSKTVRATCGASTKFVSMAEWLERLKSHEATPDNIERLPALKLLEFFDEFTKIGDGLRYEMVAASKFQAMRDMPPIDNRLMRMWLKQWSIQEKGKGSS